MKKKILLIGYNFKPEITGIGKYSGEMLEWLASEGHTCYALTGFPYYPQWKVQTPQYWQKFWYQKETETYPSGGSIRIYRCPLYVPKKPTALRRILLDCSFFVSAFYFSIYLSLTKKFDYVVTVAPAFHIGLLGLLFKKFHKSHLQYHIQDLQIEAARDLSMIKSKRILSALFNIENYIFRNVDSLSTISDGMKQKIVEKFNHDVYILPNWVDVNFFRPLPDKDTLKAKFGFQSHHKIVLYSGSIGEKQGLEMILESANRMRQLEFIQFVICGTGPSLDKLKEIRKKQKLSNVHFLSLQPLSVFNDFLNMADLHLVLQRSCASDLVMPSKLATILAVGGISLVTAHPESDLHKIISQHKIGILIEPDNQLALDQGIFDTVDGGVSQISKNARNYAMGKLSVDAVLKNYFVPFLNNDSLFPSGHIKQPALRKANPYSEVQKAWWSVW
ncbi:WcaI family glycosyltransferase [Pleomorphovibrio marinus]|uniref:WcaI family glycosyltransferase n=1 Tax=Pleomorphovibrio marinus TaxID=2164132 RepID=UPI000E0BDE8D|nr:WcaI family glycosyltransferase [Pleomorphovibrio marinus]